MNPYIHLSDLIIDPCFNMDPIIIMYEKLRLFIRARRCITRYLHSLGFDYMSQLVTFVVKQLNASLKCLPFN